MSSSVSKSVFAATALALSLATPAFADPTFGIGMTITFGSNGPDVGAGVRVFSDDEEDEFAASVGVDYMFRSKGWRGSLGGAYLMDNSYIEFNGGYNFTNAGFDFGAGGGWADTTKENQGCRNPSPVGCLD